MIAWNRWEQVYAEFLDQIIKSGNIPSDRVHPFWNFYHQEFRPGYYSQMPCTCSGRDWSAMVGQVAEAYLEAKRLHEQTNS